MQRTKPPFRADQVGSLLRSAPVKEARTRRATGEITPAELKAVEDAEISKLVARQEAIGLQAVADRGKAYAKAVRAFGEAGCTYLQLDEVFVAYLCDEAQRDYLRGRGDDPDELLDVYADLVNAACAGRTPGMTISMHLCRGNFRSTWMAQGGYERVADILFNQMGVDAYFMEYDTARAVGFEPLRLVPKNKQAVLGVMTSKTGALESKDQLKRRIDDAAKFAALA